MRPVISGVCCPKELLLAVVNGDRESVIGTPVVLQFRSDLGPKDGVLWCALNCEECDDAQYQLYEGNPVLIEGEIKDLCEHAGVPAAAILVTRCDGDPKLVGHFVRLSIVALIKGTCDRIE